MNILYCGICGSDVMLLETAFGDNSNYPIVPGHEIVGQVTQVGQLVSNIKVGDYVGVGAESDSCLECDFCIAGGFIRIRGESAQRC